MNKKKYFFKGYNILLMISSHAHICYSGKNVLKLHMKLQYDSFTECAFRLRRKLKDNICAQ